MFGAWGIDTTDEMMGSCGRPWGVDDVGGAINLSGRLGGTTVVRHYLRSTYVGFI